MFLFQERNYLLIITNRFDNVVGTPQVPTLKNLTIVCFLMIISVSVTRFYGVLKG